MRNRTLKSLCCLAMCAFAVSPAVPAFAQGDAKATKPAPRSLEDIAADMDALDVMIANYEAKAAELAKEKDAEKQKELKKYLGSLYAKMLGMANNIAIHINVQKQLLAQAIASNPKNDNVGGITKGLTDGQAKWQAKINQLEARLKRLNQKIEAMEFGKLAPVNGKDGNTETPDGGKRPG